MDSQSIGPVTGQQAATPQPAARPPQGAPAVKAAEAAQEAKQAAAIKGEKQVEVRTRDPRSLNYQVDGTTNQVVATIVDESNKLVVRQIPDAEVLRIAQAIDRMKGFLLEGKA